MSRVEGRSTEGGATAMWTCCRSAGGRQRPVCAWRALGGHHSGISHWRLVVAVHLPGGMKATESQSHHDRGAEVSRAICCHNKASAGLTTERQQDGLTVAASHSTPAAAHLLTSASHRIGSPRSSAASTAGRHSAASTHLRAAARSWVLCDAASSRELHRRNHWRAGRCERLRRVCDHHLR
jgi:hypothetical protein